MSYILIFASTMCTLIAQLLLKHVVGAPAAKAHMAADPLQFIVHAMLTPLTWFALSIQVLGYLIWLFVLSREKMAVAFAISGSVFYLVTALASWHFYSERLSAGQTVGIFLISVGVFLVAAKGSG